MGPLSAAGATREHSVRSKSRDIELEEVVTGYDATPSSGKAREELRTFPAQISSPRASRRFVIESLQGWADDELLADAALVVTELATNAVVHARSEFTVGVFRLENGARISVRDSGSHQWDRKATPLTATHGRGLGLVAALTNSWGKTATDGGKVVWAELTGGIRH